MIERAPDTTDPDDHVVRCWALAADVEQLERVADWLRWMGHDCIARGGVLHVQLHVERDEDAQQSKP